MREARLPFGRLRFALALPLPVVFLPVVFLIVFDFAVAELAGCVVVVSVAACPGIGLTTISAESVIASQRAGHCAVWGAVRGVMGGGTAALMELL